MNGTVIFDFDDTLVDTVRFKEVMDVARMPEFVFPEAFPVLRRLKAGGWRLALVTVGDPLWQERKAARSGLLPFFDHAVYTAEPKATRTAEFLAWPKPLVFVNDNGQEIDALRLALPESKMIALRGPKRPPSSLDVPLCATLEAVYEEITGTAWTIDS